MPTPGNRSVVGAARSALTHRPTPQYIRETDVLVVSPSAFAATRVGGKSAVCCAPPRRRGGLVSWRHSDGSGRRVSEGFRPCQFTVALKTNPAAGNWTQLLVAAMQAKPCAILCFLRGCKRSVQREHTGASPCGSGRGRRVAAALSKLRRIVAGQEPRQVRRSMPAWCALAGVTATLVNDACMTPWDVVKQRMQVSHSPYRSLSHCIMETWRQQGLSAFYRSYWTTVSENQTPGLAVFEWRWSG